MRVNVKPPNRHFYLERCEALRKCLDHVEVMPPFLVANMCLFVLVRTFGSDWRVLTWLIESIAANYWGRIKENAWWAWHLYITCKSRPEIQEIIDRELEEMTGEDYREWPEVVVEEEEV